MEKMRNMKKIVTLTIIISIILSGFSVSATQQTEEVIASLLGQLGIMNGDGDGNLRLDDYISRAEFTKVAIATSPSRNSVASNITISPFKDVNYTYWAAPYIKLAVTSKYITGYPDGTFLPGNPVLYEEALTIMLKILGYTDEDFGSSWPYGQIALGINLELTKNMTASAGMPITRREVMNLVYNTLDTKPKGSSNPYIVNINYNITDDVTLIATSNEDSSISSGMVLTTASNSTYKIDSSFDYSLVGKKGTLITKNSDELIGFVPNDQIINTYHVYQILGDSILVLENGELKTLDIDKNLPVYNKTAKTTINSLMSSLNLGDSITVCKTSGGVLDYGFVETNVLSNPVTVKSSDWMPELGLENPVVVRDGVKVEAQNIQTNDILYYSKSINMVWAYSKKVTGIYEDATPNKDNLTAIKLSGNTFNIEGIEAFNKLSSNGSINYGDTITILLGKSGNVVDVLSGTENENTTVAGYLLETGRKEYQTSDFSTYTSHYIKLLEPDGIANEYAADKDYSSLKNRMVTLSFRNKSVSAINPAILSGVVENGQINNYKFTQSLKIIDIYATGINATETKNKTGVWCTVFPKRIDGISLKQADILYYEKNARNEITALYLNNVTGDIFKYGIVTAVPGKDDKSPSYSYDIAGTSGTINSSFFTVAAGEAVKFESVNDKVEVIRPLTKVNTIITAVNNDTLQTSNTKYALSDNVVVYLKEPYTYKYQKILKSEIVGNSNYNFAAYFDKSEASGGRIRVIIAEKKK